MTDQTTQLSISLSRPEAGDLVQLARHSSATRQTLAHVAVQHLLTMLRGRAGTPHELHLDQDAVPLDGVGVTVTLDAVDSAALDDFANRLATSPAALGRFAIQSLLAASGAGAVPMVKTMEAPPSPEDELASIGAARLNFSKAKLILDRLHHIAEFGLDEASRAALADLDTLKTIPPF